MNKISVGGFTRITRKEARKRYNAGKVIRMCAVKLSPVNMWGCFADCCREALAAFEVEYFNTGSEWIVHEGEFDPEQHGPEDIEGYSIYCTSYKVQEEIAAYEGVKPEEVKLFEFSEFSRVPVYKAV